MMRHGAFLAAAGLLVLGGGHVGARGPALQTGTVPPQRSDRELVAQYCVGCHNQRVKTAGLALDTLDPDAPSQNTAVWEHVVRKLRARAMPPSGAARPSEGDFNQLVASLEARLDRAAAAAPNPGSTAALRRLSRLEYQRAIRDLLALDVEVSELLPADEVSFGFDNMGSGGLSPALVERYLSAAEKVSRLALGREGRAPGSRVVLVPPDLTQEDHVEGLPLGTRGGTAVTHTFPRDGVYEIQVRLARNRNENVEGLTEPHQMEVLLDGERLQQFTVTPNRNRLNQYYADESVDRNLQVRLPVSAGPHVVAVTFPRKNSALLETERQPYQAHFNADRHPRVQPAVHSVAIAGPFGVSQPGDTPSRRQILTCQPDGGEPCATRILTALARRAYRRPVSTDDVRPLLTFYRSALGDGGFDAGIETALRALLSSPEFLFRVERAPSTSRPGTPFLVSDVELASRLSFFLWSSIPDGDLLGAAIDGTLRRPAVIEQQVRRMLADPKADSLVTNFASQWLYLRNLDAVAPDPRLFPDFDQNLRDAFRRETELFVKSIFNADRSVVDLLGANYTYLNERLARHYGIGGVYGDRFRQVVLPDDSPRGGLLGHGSLLTVTSYATRTSPVNRGKWILSNIVGMAPPPPPPNVPALTEDRANATARTMRERMVQHRANPACASCHQLMDPLGLAMENFDAVGRWRTRGDGDTPLDVSGRLFGGAAFDGVKGLRQNLLARPQVFVETLTEKLLIYALGRGLDEHDAPAVRQITREAAGHHSSFSSLILGIVTSVPFQMRVVETTATRVAAGH